MTSVLAICIVIALFTVVAAGILYVAVSGTGAQTATLAGITILLGLSVYHTGGLGSADPAWAETAAAPQGELQSGRCGDLIELMRQGNVYRDEGRNRVVVQPQLWAQLPQQVQTIATGCLEQSKGLQAGKLEVIEAGGAP